MAWADGHTQGDRWTLLRVSHVGSEFTAGDGRLSRWYKWRELLHVEDMVEAQWRRGAVDRNRCPSSFHRSMHNGRSSTHVHCATASYSYVHSSTSMLLARRSSTKKLM